MRKPQPIAGGSLGSSQALSGGGSNLAGRASARPVMRRALELSCTGRPAARRCGDPRVVFTYQLFAEQQPPCTRAEQPEAAPLALGRDFLLKARANVLFLL